MCNESGRIQICPHGRLKSQHKFMAEAMFMNGATCYTNESLESPIMSSEEFASAAKKANNQELWDYLMMLLIVNLTSKYFDFLYRYWVLRDPESSVISSLKLLNLGLAACVMRKNW
ncbi:hypothetical protein HN873_028050 [Arachis hypogaea]